MKPTPKEVPEHTDCPDLWHEVMIALIALIIREISAFWVAFFLVQQSLFVYQILIGYLTWLI